MEYMFGVAPSVLHLNYNYMVNLLQPHISHNLIHLAHLINEGVYFRLLSYIRSPLFIIFYK